jgi:hypothetical protein
VSLTTTPTPLFRLLLLSVFEELKDAWV